MVQAEKQYLYTVSRSDTFVVAILDRRREWMLFGSVVVRRGLPKPEWLKMLRVMANLGLDSKLIKHLTLLKSPWPLGFTKTKFFLANLGENIISKKQAGAYSIFVGGWKTMVDVAKS